MARNKRTNIPLHRLADATTTGFLMHQVNVSNLVNVKRINYAHRDDHFLFLLQEKGRSNLMLDIEMVEANGPTLYYILPGQVHHYQLAEEVQGWFMALDNMLLGDFRTFFESRQLRREPLPLEQPQLSQLLSLLQLLEHWYQQPETTAYREQMIRHLLLSFTGTAVAAYRENEARQEKTHSRPALITRQFRQLVSTRYNEIKQPAAYAAAMHLSLSYLNEVVKATTGFPVTYWIHSEIMLEARRLLCYSDLSVKEIAHKLGYEDHTYFSRLFHKMVHATPLQFRKRHRE